MRLGSGETGPPEARDASKLRAASEFKASKLLPFLEVEDTEV